jgi:hypothetical protein
MCNKSANTGNFIKFPFANVARKGFAPVTVQKREMPKKFLSNLGRNGLYLERVFLLLQSFKQ